MATLELEPVSDQRQETASWAAVAFIASYSSPSTRRTYTTQLQLWLRWCDRHALDPLADVRRPHVEQYARQLEARGLAPATIALKIVVLTGYYRYCVEEQLIDNSPAAHVRRPRVSPESTRLGLDRNELGAFLVQAGLSGGNDHVLACLLGLGAWPSVPGSPSGSHRTHCGTPPSPRHWTPGAAFATCRTAHVTPTRVRPVATTALAGRWTATRPTSSPPTSPAPPAPADHLIGPAAPRRLDPCGSRGSRAPIRKPWPRTSSGSWTTSAS